MEKQTLERLIEQKFSLSKIGKETNNSVSTIVYWMNKYGLKTLNKKPGYSSDKKGYKICSKCEEEKVIKDFYSNSGYCKDCMRVYCNDRNKNRKIELINHFGGECKDCKLKLVDSHYSVFEFHHLDPKQKDPNIFKNIRAKKNETIMNELSKCVLLCANCHRIRHSV